MRILTIIPARGGSKGVPGKNIKLLGDVPLIAHTINAAKQAGLENIVVNSEDDQINAIALEYGAEIYKRPTHLAEDQSKSIDVVLDMVEGAFSSFDAILLLQVTYPFREPGMINKAVEKYKSETLDSLVSVLEVPAHYNPHWVFEADKQGMLKVATGENEIIPRRQDLPEAYFRDGGIYLTSKDVIIGKKSFFGKRLGYIKSNPNNYVNIDTQEDWDQAVAILERISGKQNHKS